MKEIICKICGEKIINYRYLGNHIKYVHNMISKEYYDKYIGKTYCKECGEETSYKNINIGYRGYCSVLCLNRFKSKDPIFLNKLSLLSKGKPRKKNSEETKKLISENSKIMWKTPKIRKKILDIVRSEEHRKKQSKISSEKSKSKNITYINDIRCESKTEELFVLECIKQKIKVKRFSYKNKPSIPVGNRWSIPDFLLGYVIVEVKDFHPWFKKELFEDNLIKYKNIISWCNKNEFDYVFWFEKYGFKHYEDLIKIKTEEDIVMLKKDTIW